jgi:hypothetical protein
MEKYVGASGYNFANHERHRQVQIRKSIIKANWFEFDQ